MLSFAFLLISGIVFLSSPKKAMSMLAALMAVWLEWSFPSLSDIRLGLVDVVVLCGGLGALFHLAPAQHDRKRPIRSLVLCYILISLISFLANCYSLPLDKLFWGAYKEISVSLLFFIFYTLITDRLMIEKMLNLVLLSSVASSLLSIVQTGTGTVIQLPIGLYSENVLAVASDISDGGSLRAFGTFLHANYNGAFLIWPLSICLALYLIDTKYRYRRFLPYAMGIQGIAMLFTQSRGAWVGFFVSVCIIAYHTKIYKKNTFLLIPLSLAIFLVLIKGVFPDLNLLPGNITRRASSISNYQEDPAMAPRYKRWDYFYNKSLEKPLLGHAEVASIADIEQLQYAISPHNTYFSVAVKRGYLAVGIIVLIMVRFSILSMKIFKSSNDLFFKALGVGIFAGLVGVYGVASMFGSFLEEKQITILLWFFLAIALNSVKLDEKIPDAAV